MANQSLDALIPAHCRRGNDTVGSYESAGRRRLLPEVATIAVDDMGGRGLPKPRFVSLLLAPAKLPWPIWQSHR
jgi:hypothetical protein